MQFSRTNVYADAGKHWIKATTFYVRTNLHTGIYYMFWLYQVVSLIKTNIFKNTSKKIIKLKKKKEIKNLSKNQTNAGNPWYTQIKRKTFYKQQVIWQIKKTIP